MGYERMIWEMTASIRSSPISIWDVLSLWGKVLGCQFHQRRKKTGDRKVSVADQTETAAIWSPDRTSDLRLQPYAEACDPELTFREVGTCDEVNNMAWHVILHQGRGADQRREP